MSYAFSRFKELTGKAAKARNARRKLRRKQQRKQAAQCKVVPVHTIRRKHHASAAHDQLYAKGRTHPESEA